MISISILKDLKFTILLKKIGFRPKIRKRILNLKKSLPFYFVELVEINPLMYNMKDLG